MNISVVVKEISEENVASVISYALTYATQSKNIVIVLIICYNISRILVIIQYFKERKIFMLKFKRVLSVVLVCMMVLGMNTTAVFASQTIDVPSVNYSDDINDYEEFIFKVNTRGTSTPTSKWDWDNGAYTVNGSSNSATLYSNCYFTDVVGRTFNFSAGSSSRIMVDLVHKGLFVQTVVSSWTIDAGSSKSVTIKETDLAGEEKDGKYYFRFNSNPLGNKYSVSGTFN